ncbi:hypothetical protein RF55_16795 [Lasius niger]|uniref:Uncharacterized protein n=1 Tax=Lasius niger TaxID=67767 RepID=A0A0J7K3Q1_LASNI|nr:hypothetical protein RF55_16795 [Lasius niger]
MKKEYEILCKRKEEENEKWVKRAQEARTEGQVWKIVKREKGRIGGRVGEGIEMGKWNGYFKDLLGGIKGRVILRSYRGEWEDNEEGGN